MIVTCWLKVTVVILAYYSDSCCANIYIHLKRGFQVYKYTEEKFGSLKVGKRFLLKMEAPNTPNPGNPNAQGDPGQNQDQVPAGQAPAPGPAQPVPQPAPAGVIPIPQIFYQIG